MVSQKSDVEVVALGFDDPLTADCMEEKQPHRNQRIVHSPAML